nr:MAG TPA: hypothetical protein [Caudoviricetes sp.]
MYSGMTRPIGRSRCRYRLSHAAHLRQQQHQAGAQMIPHVGYLLAIKCSGDMSTIMTSVPTLLKLRFFQYRLPRQFTQSVRNFT